MIDLDHVSWGVPGRTIVDDVTLSFARGRLTAVLGPNGCGKTTLMHLVGGLLSPDAGTIRLDGQDLSQIRPRRRAARIALVEQHPSTDLDLSVHEVVELGRIPHVRRWPGARDPEPGAVDEAMHAAAVQDLAHRRWPTLSGGERQRVQLARALAQRPEVLLLDEPTNHLDLSHQLDLLERVATSGLTVVAILHDLDLSAAFCDDVVILERGRVHAVGAVAEALTEQVVADVFGVRARVTQEERLRVTWSRSP